MSKQKLKFPNGFLWGAATSAHQIEGNNTNSDWWEWEHSLSRRQFLESLGKNPEAFQSGIACDSYNRYEEDFALAQHLNHNATRLGIEWARIEPREGFFDEVELDHCEKVLQSAKAHGLTTFVTLHHYTLPRWFAACDGFARKENIEKFVRYSGTAVKRLDEYVDFWMTINEPEVYFSFAYLNGLYPPNERNPLKAWGVLQNLILAHNHTYDAIRQITNTPISMAFHLSDIQPVSALSAPLTYIAHRFANEYIIGKTIKHCDYIGVNYYFHHHIGWLGKRKHSHSGHERNDLGWGIHPEGLGRVLVALKKFNKPIYITENGLADAKDRIREKFIKDHLLYVHKAIQQGADVRGYLHWSLIDNFEWTEGFGPRFGLIEIDREDNLRRRVRFSATKYAEICKNNTLEY